MKTRQGDVASLNQMCCKYKGIESELDMSNKQILELQN